MNKFLKRTIELLKFFTYSGNEAIMKDYLIDQIVKLRFEVEVDTVGNIYCTRGNAKKYPLLNAHMDIVFDVDHSVSNLITKTEVKKEKTTKRTCTNCENFWDCINMIKDPNEAWHKAEERLIQNEIYAQKCDSYKYDEYSYSYLTDDDGYVGTSYWKDYDSYSSYGYYSNYYMSDEEKKVLEEILQDEYKINYEEKTGKITTNKLRVLGGDDKCGIAIALQVAEELRNTPMKLLFTVEEETGCIGIRDFCKTNSKWFNDVKHSITIDRRGDDELITNSCGEWNGTRWYATEMAKQAINAGIMVKLEYGTVADVIEIRKYVKNTCNISAGYHNPHTVDEWINFSAMIKLKNWVKNAVTFI